MRKKIKWKKRKRKHSYKNQGHEKKWRRGKTLIKKNRKKRKNYVRTIKEAVT